MRVPTIRRINPSSLHSGYLDALHPPTPDPRPELEFAPASGSLIHVGLPHPFCGAVPQDWDLEEKGKRVSFWGKSNGFTEPEDSDWWGESTHAGRYRGIKVIARRTGKGTTFSGIKQYQFATHFQSG